MHRKNFTLNLSENDGLALFELFRNNKAHIILSVVGDDGQHFTFPIGIASARLWTGRDPNRDYGTTTQLDVDIVQLTPLPDAP